MLASLSLGLVACLQSTDLLALSDQKGAEASEALTLSTADNAAEELFDADAFETFDLVLSEENLAFLDADPTAEQYVPGSMVFDGEEFPAGIRYKGSVGGWHRGPQRCVGEGFFSPMPQGPKTCHKLSFKVSFNEYDPEGRFKGLKKVLFHSLNQDDSLMRERLAYEIFRKMGVAAPRASHARLLINGQFWGVYAFVEYIDGRFTRSRWSNGEGNLYKERWPQVTPLFRENTEAVLRSGLRTNEDEDPSFAGFVGFESAVAEADGDRARLRAMAHWVDLDYMLRYVAADRATAHDDGPLHFYPTQGGAPWSNHNFYWYESVGHDRLWLIPWDMDNTWNMNNPITDLAFDWSDRDAGCEVQAGSGFTPAKLPPACHPIIRAIADPTLQVELAERVAELLDHHLSEAVVEERLSRWSALIADSVQEAADTFEGELSVSEWHAARTALTNAIEHTRNELRAMIDPTLKP